MRGTDEVEPHPGTRLSRSGCSAAGSVLLRGSSLEAAALQLGNVCSFELVAVTKACEHRETPVRCSAAPRCPRVGGRSEQEPRCRRWPWPPLSFSFFPFTSC